MVMVFNAIIENISAISFSRVRVAQSLVFWCSILQIMVSHFVPFLATIAWSVLFTIDGYPFGIIKLFIIIIVLLTMVCGERSRRKFATYAVLPRIVNQL
jgi:magnesium-transporting ATPase (P-type)